MSLSCTITTFRLFRQCLIQRGVRAPWEKFAPLREVRTPLRKNCTPLQNFAPPSKYDQFNDKIKQFSTKTAFFSYWTVKFSSVFACGGLFQDDWFRLMSSLDAPPLGILTPFPEILTWSQAVNKFFNKLIILLFFQRFSHLAIWKLSVSRGICGCCC